MISCHLELEDEDLAVVSRHDLEAAYRDLRAHHVRERTHLIEQIRYHRDHDKHQDQWLDEARRAIAEQGRGLVRRADEVRALKAEVAAWASRALRDRRRHFVLPSEAAESLVRGEAPDDDER